MEPADHFRHIITLLSGMWCTSDGAQVTVDESRVKRVKGANHKDVELKQVSARPNDPESPHVTVELFGWRLIPETLSPSRAQWTKARGTVVVWTRPNLQLQLQLHDPVSPDFVKERLQGRWRSTSGLPLNVVGDKVQPEGSSKESRFVVKSGEVHWGGHWVVDVPSSASRNWKTIVWRWTGAGSGEQKEASVEWLPQWPELPSKSSVENPLKRKAGDALPSSWSLPSSLAGIWIASDDAVIEVRDCTVFRNGVVGASPIVVTGTRQASWSNWVLTRVLAGGDVVTWESGAQTVFWCRRVLPQTTWEGQVEAFVVTHREGGSTATKVFPQSEYGYVGASAAAEDFRLSKLQKRA
jgi:hypothetical protein